MESMGYRGYKEYQEYPFFFVWSHGALGRITGVRAASLGRGYCTLDTIALRAFGKFQTFAFAENTYGTKPLVLKRLLGAAS